MQPGERGEAQAPEQRPEAPRRVQVARRVGVLLAEQALRQQEQGLALERVGERGQQPAVQVPVLARLARAQPNHQSHTSGRYPPG